MLDKEGEKEASVTFLEQAADLFATENSKSEANKCNLKVGGECGGEERRTTGGERPYFHTSWLLFANVYRQILKSKSLPHTFFPVFRHRTPGRADPGGAGPFPPGDRAVRVHRQDLCRVQPAQVQVSRVGAEGLSQGGPQRQHTDRSLRPSFRSNPPAAPRATCCVRASASWPATRRRAAGKRSRGIGTST